jgi:uncharacterized LabA/DUF88 family protein
MERVVAYVDGFNLYYGLRASGYRRYYWLDLQALAANLLLVSQQLVGVDYFTARIAGPGGKQQRQECYLQALAARRTCTLHFGRYQHSERACRQCGHVHRVPSEKMTDVTIAVQLMTDAFHDRFDTALLISADSDLVPPVRALRRLFPHKRVVVAFPPGRNSVALAQAAHAYLRIGRATLARSLLPGEVCTADGYVLRCPEGWQ